MFYNLFSKLKSLASENLPLKIIHLLKFLNNFFFFLTPQTVGSDNQMSDQITVEGHLKYLLDTLFRLSIIFHLGIELKLVSLQKTF